jgi:hypothetical protein
LIASTQTGKGPHCEQSGTHCPITPQKHLPVPTSGAWTHSSLGPHTRRASQSRVGHWGLAANAGMRRLVRIGAGHATAAPAPMRLSTLRREAVPLYFARDSASVS